MDRAAGSRSPQPSLRPTLAAPPSGNPLARPPTATLDDAVAFSPAMLEVMERVHRYARAKTPVVFVGETGTGKSYFAEALHRASGRTGPFVDATALEIDPELARSQLFGHVRGAFTGADRAHVGLLGQAERGTLLLDDFHLMRRSVQATLLRALERGLYRPLQAERDVPVGCRLVFGMRHDPATLVARGKMLEDLRSRLGFMMVQLPPLGERRDEIPVLAARFLHAAPEATGVSGGPSAFTPEALTVNQVRSAGDPGRASRSPELDHGFGGTSMPKTERPCKGTTRTRSDLGSSPCADAP